MNFEFEVKTEIYFEEMIDREDCSKCKIYRCSCYYYQYVIWINENNELFLQEIHSPRFDVLSFISVNMEK